MVAAEECQVFVRRVVHLAKRAAEIFHSFAFHGYLPIDASERTNTIKKLEGRIYSEHQTQLFIETPYRNNKLAEELIRTCRPSTKLCIASNITCEDEYIHTRPVKEWAGKVPDLSKKPTIFLIYK